jgi:hypothetical protein
MNDWVIWVILLLFIGIFVWSFTRRRASGGMNLDIALGVLSNVEDCLRTIEVRLADPQSKQKFQNASWKVFNKKLDFLKPETILALNQAFTMVDEFNQRIDTARKSKMMGTLQDMPVDKLKAPMLKAREGLSAYVKGNHEDELKKRRGCLGF